MFSNIKLPEADGNISQTAGFCFKQRHGKLNWNQIHNLDFDEIAQTGDIEMLQTVLENATYSVLDRSDLERFGDVSMLKVFKLNQLGVEYLLYVQNTLFSQNETLKESYTTLTDNADSVQDTIKSQEKEILELQEELSQKRKAVSTYQQILRQPATANVLNKVMAKANAVKCPQCNKLFMSENYLERHIMRRHSEPIHKQQEEVKIPEINILVDNMKNFMSDQLKYMADTQNRKLQTLQSAFDKEISELYIKQKDLESIRVQSASIRTQSPSKDAQYMKILLEETKKEKEYIQTLMKEKSLRFTDYEQKLKKFKEENFQLAKQKQELEISLSSISKQDPILKDMKTTHTASISIDSKPITPNRPFSGFSEIQQPERPSFYSTVKMYTPSSNAGELESDASSEENDLFTADRIIPKLHSNAGELESDIPSDEEFERESVESNEAIEEIPVMDISIKIERAEQKLKENSIEEIVLSPGNKKIDLEAELQHADSREEYMEVKEAYESFKGDQKFKLQKVMNLIGITQEHDKRYEYLAKQLVKTVENIEELAYDHPLVEEYSNKFMELKAKHTNLHQKCLKALAERPESASQTHTYNYGMKCVFDHNSLIFEEMKESLKSMIHNKLNTEVHHEVQPGTDNIKAKLMSEMVHLFTNLKPETSAKPLRSTLPKDVLDSISERKESQESSLKTDELEDTEEHKSFASTHKANSYVSIISTSQLKHTSLALKPPTSTIKRQLSESTASTPS